MLKRIPLAAGLILAFALTLGAQDAVDPAFKDLCAKTDKDCPLCPQICEDCQKFQKSILPFIPTADNLTPARATTDQISKYDDWYRGIKNRSDKAAYDSFKSTTSADRVAPFAPALGLLRKYLYKASFGAVEMDINNLTDVLEDLEGQTGQLEKDVAKAPTPIPADAQAKFRARLSPINETGMKLMSKVQQDSLIVDRTDTPNGRGGGVDNQGIDPLQDRLLALRTRLIALGGKLGVTLATPPPADQAAVQKGKDQMAKAGSAQNPFQNAADGTPAAGGAKAPAQAGQTPMLPPTNLTDLKVLPPPTPFDAKAPQPNLWGGNPLPGWPAETADPKALAQVQQMRQAGQTETHGDVAGRAGLVYQQTGETCGIASQVELEAAAGTIPNTPEAKRAEEDRLFKVAMKNGYFTGNTDVSWNYDRWKGGTPFEYTGNVSGLPLDKHFKASDDALFKEINGGKVAIVAVDAGVLWNNQTFAGGGHDIVVTGVEVDKYSGKPLGYYVNDTGYNQGGRFVPIGQFLDAWHRFGHFYVDQGQ